MRDLPPEPDEKRQVIFAIPSYDCSIHAEIVGGMIVAGKELQKAGIEWGLIYEGGTSIVSKSRNSLVNVFLGMPDATDLVFIDSDVVFKAEEMLKLIAWGAHRDIVCGVYRIKDDEQRRYTIHPYKDDNGALVFDETQRLIKVVGAGSGFMLIRRHVFETITEKLSPETYKAGEDDDTQITAFYHFEVKDGQYIGEDIYFCREAAKAGFDVWADPSIELSHVGPKKHTGRLSDEFKIIRSEDKVKEIA